MYLELDDLEKTFRWVEISEGKVKVILVKLGLLGTNEVYYLPLYHNKLTDSQKKEAQRELLKEFKDTLLGAL